MPASDDALTPKKPTEAKPGSSLLEYLTTAKPLPPEDWFDLPDDPPPEPVDCFDDWTDDELNQTDPDRSAD